MLKPKKSQTKVQYWNCSCGKTKIRGPKKVTILAMRHGESRHNVLGIVNGDPKKHYHLTAKGRWQARDLAQKLSHKNISAILASEMLRTQETAEPLAKLKSLPVLVDKRLNDIHAGRLEGKNILEFRKLTEEIKRSVGGSETTVKVAKRLKSFLEDLLKAYNGKTIALVSSEIILHSLKQVSLGLPCDESIGRHIKNGVVTEFHIHNPVCCPSCGDRCSI